MCADFVYRTDSSRICFSHFAACLNLNIKRVFISILCLLPLVSVDLVFFSFCLTVLPAIAFEKEEEEEVVVNGFVVIAIDE